MNARTALAALATAAFLAAAGTPSSAKAEPAPQAVGVTRGTTLTVPAEVTADPVGVLADRLRLQRRDAEQRSSIVAIDADPAKIVAVDATTRVADAADAAHADSANTDTDAAAIAAAAKDSGASVQSRIDPSWEEEYWSVRADAGDTLIVGVTRLSGSLDALLWLYDPTGVEVAFDDDSGGDANPLLVQQARRTGDYTVRVRSYARATKGDYRLDVVWQQEESGYPGPSCSGQALAYGRTVRDGLTFWSPRRTFCVANGASGRATVRMSARDGSDLDTFIEVYDDRGNLVADDDDSGPATDSFVVFSRRSGSRSYSIVVSGFDGSTGDYAMRIEDGAQAAFTDLNRDCAVNTIDHSLLLTNLGQSAPDGSSRRHLDVNLDGVVNGFDLALFRDEVEFGQVCR